MGWATNRNPVGPQPEPAPQPAAKPGSSQSKGKTGSKKAKTRAQEPRHAPKASKKPKDTATAAPKEARPASEQPKSEPQNPEPSSPRTPTKKELESWEQGNRIVQEEEIDLGEMEAEIIAQLKEEGIEKPSADEIREAMIERAKRDAASDFQDDGHGNAVGLSLMVGDKRIKKRHAGNEVDRIHDRGTDGVIDGARQASAEAIHAGEMQVLEEAGQRPDADQRLTIDYLAQGICVYNDTPFLIGLKQRHRGYYEHSLRWRPIFLAALTLCPVELTACRRTGISTQTLYAHIKLDEVFREQIRLAKAKAVELLFASSWKSAVEGDMEPVFFQGVQVGAIRRYDSKLRIEMLRAHLPELFKPANININQRVNSPDTHNNNSIVITQEKLDELRERRKAALAGRRQEKQAEAKVV